MQTVPYLIKLVVCQMALNGVNTSTIDFLKMVYADPTRIEKPINTTQMARLNHMTRAAATPHRDRLEKNGVLVRRSFKAWTLNPAFISEPFLLSAKGFI